MDDETSIPPQVRTLANGVTPVLAWVNQLGGRTYRVGDRFVKWNPISTGINLDRERTHLIWLADRHPVPRLIELGSDAEGQWLVTAAMSGESAVSESFRTKPDAAVAAIASGLRSFHSIDADHFLSEWSDQSWATRSPDQLGPRRPINDPVLVHGDACAPNTLIGSDGQFAGHVDLLAVAVGDRWADLAVASMSLDWNYGEGFQDMFFDA